MKNISTLLRDRQFLADLLNGPCRPLVEEEFSPLEVVVSSGGKIRLSEKPRPVFRPFEASQIDEEGSRKMTAVYENLLPGGVPLLSKVVVVKGERTRYIVLTVIPDRQGPGCDVLEPMICDAISCLDLWEDCRVKTAAVVKNWYKGSTPDTDPTALVTAHIEWVNLYVGHEAPSPWSITNFYDLRSMEDYRCRKLVAVYDHEMEELAFLRRMVSSAPPAPPAPPAPATTVVSDMPQATAKLMVPATLMVPAKL
ncbi:MAG: hypothetical protein IIZ39_10595 [Blautia sp.]|nr:hypothetical protein [Blautia sp.]